MEDLLADIVDRDGNVDYARLRHDDLHVALQAIASADLKAMKGHERYAFLINAYNLCVLDGVQRVLMRNGRPVRSLRRPWTWLRFFLFTPMRVGGRRISLFRLEYHWLRWHLKRDPRGHFALVCASTGCPPLRDGLFHAESLDAELEMAGKAFLRPGGGYILDRETKTLRLNRIFKWFRRDFRRIGDLYAVFARFAPDDDGDWVEAHRPRIRFLRYGWDLNIAKAGP